jgi:hypothetical protein
MIGAGALLLFAGVISPQHYPFQFHSRKAKAVTFSRCNQGKHSESAAPRVWCLTGKSSRWLNGDRGSILGLLFCQPYWQSLASS